MLFKTVGPLVKFLSALPPETAITACGPDIGGYDQQECDLFSVVLTHNGNAYMSGDHGDPTFADTRPEGNNGELVE